VEARIGLGQEPIVKPFPLLVAAWVAFIISSVLLSALCISMVFFPPAQQLPGGVLEVLALILALRILTPRVSRLHGLQGESLENSNPGRAIAHYQWGLRLQPQATELYQRWALVLLSQGQTELAQQRLNQGLAQDPGDASLWNALGRTLLQQGQWQAANNAFKTAYCLQRGLTWHKLEEDIQLPQQVVTQTPAPPEHTSRAKLQHDLEQYQFLLAGRYLPPSFSKPVQDLEALLTETQSQPGPRLTLNPAQQKRLPLYGRNVYFADVPAFRQSPLQSQHWLSLSDTYHQQAPGLVSWDGFLHPDAVDALLHFCEKSTIWHDDSKSGGYLGSYLEDGFCCELLLQIAHELQQALPAVLGGLHLQQMWGYKYGANSTGIGVHADNATVNVNFWITPDEANLDPDSGGLIVYDKTAPQEWLFHDYNARSDETLQTWLKEHQAQPRVIPYRQNRVVMFHSRCFHATDHFHFRSGYVHRRLNITLLFA
jgi:hypothetical protein